jgi:hypothetical protein
MRFTALVMLSLLFAAAVFGVIFGATERIENVPHVDAPWRCICDPCDCGAGCACCDVGQVQAIVDKLPKEPAAQPTLPAELITAAKEVEAAAKAVAKTVASIDRTAAAITNAVDVAVSWVPSVAIFSLACLCLAFWALFMWTKK